ncbi:hypothetical protein ES708_24258 [subsurface metagenome]
MQKLKIKNKGGEKASRNNPKYYSKQNQKEIQLEKKLSFSRKHLSLERSYTSLGISENLINLLNVGISGEIFTVGGVHNLGDINYDWGIFLTSVPYAHFV